MLGMGWPEMFVVAVVAMLVLGPDRLPDFARQTGQLVKSIRRLADSARSELVDQVDQEIAALNLRDLEPRGLVADPHLGDESTTT